jgi:hypothetical protein
VAWRAATRIVAGVGDLVQRTGNGFTDRILDGHTIERSDGAVHVETRSAGFLVEPQNQDQQFISGLASKSLGRFVSGLASKPLRWFSPVWPQNRWWRVSQFVSQNR